MSGGLCEGFKGNLKAEFRKLGHETLGFGLGRAVLTLTMSLVASLLTGKAGLPSQPGGSAAADYAPLIRPCMGPWESRGFFGVASVACVHEGRVARKKGPAPASAPDPITVHGHRRPRLHRRIKIQRLPSRDIIVP